MKYDGYRIGCRIRRSDVSLVSRNGRDWTSAFPEVVAAARKLGVHDALLDGEVAIVLPDGRTSFQALQNAFGGGPRRGLAYFVFDLLRLAGETIARQPLETRKARLFDLVGRPRKTSLIRYSEHVEGRGAQMFAEACRLGLEGIVSKRRDAPYKPGRSDTWVKTKCVHRQEFVIGGFTDPEGSRRGIGALLVGYYPEPGGPLRFAGKVGTGFTVAVAEDLRTRLDALERRDSPFSPPPAGWLGSHAHWVQPSLVAEVMFTEWTEDGKIRHPSFQGLRRDKPPRGVRREDAVESPPAASGRPVVAEVAISHPDRVLYPAERLTKLDIAQYYERIGDEMLPHVEGRALTLVRCPDGLGGECFYMKHSKVWAPSQLRRVRIQEKTKVGEYLVIQSVPGLVALAQMGILEIHTWNTRVEHVEKPDRLVLDLDPGAKATWKEVVEGARLVRRLLEHAGLQSFPKTTGGRGLHVVVPLRPVADWQACLEFTRRLAVAMQRTDPDRYTTAFAKSGRERKILVDYLRNNRTNTSVAAFSTRARAGAPVSVPLRWREVTATLDPASFTVRTIFTRLSRLRTDPWDGYWTSRQQLPKRIPW